MAYTIYSHYDPSERARLERETGQIPQDGQEIDPAEAWEVEAKLTFKRQLVPPPRFVPAAAVVGPSVAKLIEPRPPTSDVADWYRSLTKTTDTSHTRSCPKSTDSKPSAVRPTLENRNKNNWFIMNAIPSEPPPPPATSPSTLADILTRDPPPLPHEEPYTPPGFTMLQNSDIAPRDMIATGSGKTLHMRSLVKTLDDTAAVENRTTTTPSAPASGVHAHGLRKALVTPIATAKTEGPYKASQKRITHNAAGSNRTWTPGFARQRKAEEANRQMLLAYMKE
ncbi:hypothetical protein B0H10DRAFT_2076504 [Mycena sp. CBHHK59/15]|nr:hypothetical protein B0H10DRAFT_2076504 [Mycena sp. CBHHK59/15]